MIGEDWAENLPNKRWRRFDINWMKLQDVSCWGIVVSWFVWKYCIVLWKCYVSVSQYPIVGTAAARGDSSTSFLHQSRTPLIKGLGFNCHHFIIVLWLGMNNSSLIGQPASDSSLIGQFNFTAWLFKWNWVSINCHVSFAGLLFIEMQQYNKCACLQNLIFNIWFIF